MKQKTRVAIGPGPHRDRHQHDIHAGKRRNRQRREQRAHCRNRLGHLQARLCLKPDVGKTGNQIGDGDIGPVGHRDLPGSQVDPCRDDAVEPAKRALDFGHAAGAMHAGDNQNSKNRFCNSRFVHPTPGQCPAVLAGHGSAAHCEPPPASSVTLCKRCPLASARRWTCQRPDANGAT